MADKLLNQIRSKMTRDELFLSLNVWPSDDVDVDDECDCSACKRKINRCRYISVTTMRHGVLFKARLCDTCFTIFNMSVKEKYFSIDSGSVICTKTKAVSLARFIGLESIE